MTAVHDENASGEESTIVIGRTMSLVGRFEAPVVASLNIAVQTSDNRSGW